MLHLPRQLEVVIASRAAINNALELVKTKTEATKTGCSSFRAEIKRLSKVKAEPRVMEATTTLRWPSIRTIASAIAKFFRTRLLSRLMQSASQLNRLINESVTTVIPGKDLQMK